MKLFLLGVLVGPIALFVILLAGYYAGRIMWTMRPKDPIEGPNRFWGSFSVFDKKYLDEK